MTLEEHIKRYDDRAKSIRNAIVEKKESQEVVELLRELKSYKDARVGCEYCKHNYREQHERPCSLCQRNFMDMFESEVNADEDSD
jgi:hypothetical protein